MALTDHSPRLTVARGLTAERLEQQLDVVADVNRQLAPFRLLTGIEVDILDDGSLDQNDELLGRLDVVVASVHSKLRMASAQMTPRMVAAVANPHTDILGHCTGRMVGSDRSAKLQGFDGSDASGDSTGRDPHSRHGREGRPESEFDADIVFEACASFGVAVEVNSRPERLDPPKRLLRMALERGCLVSVDTDAHAPGQLEWQPFGCDRLADCGGSASQWSTRGRSRTCWPGRPITIIVRPADVSQSGRFDIHRNGDRFRTTAPGLDSRHAFSFGPHYDPDNLGFGPLLVSNEDRLDPGTGFERHAHRGVDIVTWMLAGTLEHEDSTGQRHQLSAGSAQRLRAGSGVHHAEHAARFR